MRLSAVEQHIILALQTEQKKRDLGRVESLTERERLVLEMVAQGMSVKEIARKLSKHICTVSHQRDAIVQKLGAKHMAHAVAIYKDRQIAALKGDPIRNAITDVGAGADCRAHLCFVRVEK